VVDWIEAELGPVVSIERQPRWRPAWYVEVRRHGEPLHLYVRGEREDVGTMSPLRQEAEVLRVLEKNGIPVPHVYGVLAEPAAIIMEKLPGRVNLGTVDDDSDRQAILYDYIEVLARMHTIDPSAFEAAGLARPTNVQETALGLFDRFVERYRRAKERPEPLLEFAIKWVRRNVPTHSPGPTFVTADSAQFIFHERRVRGILDLEFAYLGDPAHDLAGCRLRNLHEPVGDLGVALRHYEEISGVPLDLPRIDFHTVQWALCTPLSMVAMVHATPSIPELMQYVEWFHQYSLITVETIAGMAGVPLENVELHPEVIGRYDGVHKALTETIRSLTVRDPIDQYRRDSTAVTAAYVHMVNVHGTAVETADLDDASTLLGERPATWQEGDAALERFVLGAGPEYDAALIQLFHTRAMRQMRLMEPTLQRTKGIAHLTPLPQLLGRRNS
jgi:aminoglycoside phosphotransferase (APT) family kinase protein